MSLLAGISGPKKLTASGITPPFRPIQGPHMQTGGPVPSQGNQQIQPYGGYQGQQGAGINPNTGLPYGGTSLGPTGPMPSQGAQGPHSNPSPYFQQMAADAEESARRMAEQGGTYGTGSAYYGQHDETQQTPEQRRYQAERQKRMDALEKKYTGYGGNLGGMLSGGGPQVIPSGDTPYQPYQGPQGQLPRQTTQRYYGDVNPPEQPEAPAPQTQQPEQPFNPNYGLAGAESAIQAGLSGAGNALEQGQRGALSSLGSGYNLGQGQLQQGINALNYRGGVGAQQAQAANLNQQAGQGQYSQGVQGIQHFQDAGRMAQQRQLALSGALGQQAFDEARINDPAQAFLREQGERSVVNQAAATGGLGGGNVLKELTRFGQGLASQNLQQERAAANQLAGQGLQAAGQAGQLLGQAGNTAANMASQQANMQNQVGMQNAQLGTQAAMANAQNQMAMQRAQAGLYGQGAGMAQQMASQGANIKSNFGSNAANLFSGAGNNMANLRSQAGRDIAAQIGATTGGMADLAQQQGSGLADLFGSGAANISNLLSGFGQMSAAQKMQIMNLLANTSINQGTQLSGLQGGIGQAQANQALRQGQNAGDLAGNLAGMYAMYQGMQNKAGG